MEVLEAIQFLYKDQDIRAAVSEIGEPLFCAKDVTDILGYANGRKAVIDHCKPEGVTKRATVTKGGIQSLTYISEGNLYRLILRSTLPEAERFEKMVAEEILPSIRKHGVYATATTIETMLSDPDAMIETLQALKAERQKRLESEQKAIILTSVIKEQAPKVVYYDEVLSSESLYAATQVAADLGLTATKLNAFLASKSMIFRVNGTWVPSAKIKGLDLMKSKTYTYTDTKGEVMSSQLFYYTEKGRKHVIELVKEHRDKGLIGSIV